MPIVVPFRSAIELCWVFFPVITALERVRVYTKFSEDMETSTCQLSGVVT